MDQLVLAPAARRDAVLQLMRSAQHRLVLSMFRCDDFTVLDEVAAAVKRNVEVRVLLTNRARGWKQKLKELRAVLESTGADVQTYTGSLMKYHGKYIVVDDGPAVVSTLNFTRKCFESTCDFLVISDDPDIVSGVNIIFDNDCHRPGSQLPKITDRLIVGPDHARERLTRLLAQAQRKIRIIDHRIVDPQMLTLLRNKQDSGVSVQILGRGFMGGLISHGRMILVDDCVAVVGSIHLSPPSLNSRREIAILVREQSLVHELNEFFESLATHSSNIVDLFDAQLSETENEEEDDEDDEKYSPLRA